MNRFYTCSTAAAIEIITGEDFGRKILLSKDDTMNDLLEKYCQLCGHYYNKVDEKPESDIIDNNKIGELGIVIEKYFKIL